MAVSHDERSLQELYGTFARFDEPEDIRNLLFDLCTTREVEEMAQRLTVARMLDEGRSYVVIQEATGASATTIARVSKFLNRGAGGYRKALSEKRDGEDA